MIVIFGASAASRDKLNRGSFHVYAVCWNEARLLPAFLHHYRDAERVVVLDNESDDGSRDIVLAAGREVRVFSTGGTLDDLTNMRLKNEEWKRSRGTADWVIVQDLDEFVHFPRHPDDLRLGFAELSENGCNAARAVAYDMYCTDAEWEALRVDQSVVAQITQGRRVTERNYDKVLVFRPDAITETRYSPGAHFWDPPDKLALAPEELRPLNLHYKHLGLEYELARRIAMGQRLSQANLEHGYGVNYRASDDAHQFTVVQTYSDPSVADVAPILFPPPWAVVSPCQGASVAMLADRERDRGQRAAAALAAWCAQRESAGFLDLGAGAGLHSFTALACGASKVVSVESRLDEARRLRRGIQANGWTGNARLVVRDGAEPGQLASEFAGCSRIAIRMEAAALAPEPKRLLRDSRAELLLVEFDPTQRPLADLLRSLGELQECGFRVATCELREDAANPAAGPIAARISAWIASSIPGAAPLAVRFALQRQRALEITMRRAGRP